MRDPEIVGVFRPQGEAQPGPALSHVQGLDPAMIHKRDVGSENRALLR
jgi:hypothetical protein